MYEPASHELCGDPIVSIRFFVVLQNYPTFWWSGKEPVTWSLTKPTLRRSPTFTSTGLKTKRLCRWRRSAPLLTRSSFLHPLLTLLLLYVYKQEQHLGCGTRTNIYSGKYLVKGKGDTDEDEGFRNNSKDQKSIRVVLKVLDQSHKDIALVSLESHSRY